MVNIKKLLLSSVSLFVCLEATAAVVSPNSEQTSRLRITNKCDQTLWIQQDWKSTTNDPIVVKIDEGSSYDYSIPDIGLASTRFWPKSGCNEHGYDCKVGESTGVPDAEKKGWQHGPYAPDINSKFETTWGCLKSIHSSNPKLCAQNPSDPANNLGEETWWNGSAVDGYTFPYSINVKNHQSSCMDIISGKPLKNPGVDCSKLSVQACPTDVNLSTEGKFNAVNGVNITRVNLQFLDQKTGTPIGCFSPCAKLTTAQGSDNGRTEGGWKNILGGLNPESPEAQMYCCPTPPVSPEQCSAGPAARSAYAQSVHTVQQCDSYTYAYDDAKGLARCGSQTKFEIILCPKPGDSIPGDADSDDENPPAKTLPVKMLVPSNVSAQIDGVTMSNNQMAPVTDGSVASLLTPPKTSCVLKLDDQDVVSGSQGELCAELVFDNSVKSIAFPEPKDSDAPSIQLQFNMNTGVGISAYLNGTQIVNATPIKGKNLPPSCVLTAYQNNKQASCNLTVGTDSVKKGSGELCDRLNIVKDVSNVHVYLPADIPNMGDVGPKPDETNISVIFGMESDIRAYFNKELVTKDSKMMLKNIPDASNIELVATQNANTASCQFSKTGDVIKMLPNTGTLCNAGLSIITKSNGDYFIALPNPIPKSEVTKQYNLGIASGMIVEVNGQSVRWDSPNKSVSLKEGTNVMKIIGGSKVERSCSLTLINNALTIPQTSGCVGVVVNGGVIYFPAF